jgi:hypothetical protein
MAWTRVRAFPSQRAGIDLSYSTPVIVLPTNQATPVLVISEIFAEAANNFPFGCPHPAAKV